MYFNSRWYLSTFNPSNLEQWPLKSRSHLSFFILLSFLRNITSSSIKLQTYTSGSEKIIIKNKIKYKMDSCQGPTIQHMQLCSVLCGGLGGRKVWGRMDTCVCMAESLWCSPKTATISLVSYTPYKIKSWKKILSALAECPSTTTLPCLANSSLTSQPFHAEALSNGHS